MNVKIKTVYGELSFTMTQENALALISTATKYSSEYADGTDPRNDMIDALAYATATAAKIEKPANTKKEPNAPPTEKPTAKSRLESLFGAKSDWKIPEQPSAAPEPTKDTESVAEEETDGYKGFLYVECEECGTIKGFCVKRPIAYHKCECGHETKLTDLLPAHVKCECNSRFTYHTNIQGDAFTIDCLHCSSPVDMELNGKGTAFVTVAFSEMYKQRGSKK